MSETFDLGHTTDEAEGIAEPASEELGANINEERECYPTFSDRYVFYDMLRFTRRTSLGLLLIAAGVVLASLYAIEIEEP